MTKKPKQLNTEKDNFVKNGNGTIIHPQLEEFWLFYTIQKITQNLGGKLIIYYRQIQMLK